MTKKGYIGPRIHLDVETAIDKGLAQSRAGLPTVRVTKRESYREGPHPNGIDVGYTTTGIELRPLALNNRYEVRRANSMHIFSTSTVTEIVDDTHFKTMNGLYEIEYL